MPPPVPAAAAAAAAAAVDWGAAAARARPLLAASGSARRPPTPPQVDRFAAAAMMAETAETIRQTTSAVVAGLRVVVLCCSTIMLSINMCTRRAGQRVDCASGHPGRAKTSTIASCGLQTLHRHLLAKNVGYSVGCPRWQVSQNRLAGLGDPARRTNLCILRPPSGWRVAAAGAAPRGPMTA